MEGERKMYEGNWSCSGCGAAITKLPFEPKSEAGLTCRDCFSKNRGGGRKEGSSGERQMYEGDWHCAECGGKITKLPFQPRETGNLKCLDCFKKQ